MVPRGRNLWDQLLLVNSMVLISKIDVIQGILGAISLFFVVEVSFSCISWKRAGMKFNEEIGELLK